jgi:hypothetical protein
LSVFDPPATWIHTLAGACEKMPQGTARLIAFNLLATAHGIEAGAARCRLIEAAGAGKEKRPLKRGRKVVEAEGR